LTDIDLGSSAFWELDSDLRDGGFATLRREAPVAFHREPEAVGFAIGPRHWAVTKFDDVRHASRHPEIFSSQLTSTAIRDVPAESPNSWDR
jgi:cytochrome P450